MLSYLYLAIIIVWPCVAVVLAYALSRLIRNANALDDTGDETTYGDWPQIPPPRGLHTLARANSAPVERDVFGRGGPSVQSLHPSENGRG